ncbi:MAG: tyrosine-protein kinase family protein [Candidatus Hodarchaeota archaeon]
MRTKLVGQTSNEDGIMKRLEDKKLKWVDSSESFFQNEGTIYTFYSFKGGVGRSMGLANVGALLAYWGERVLIIDWDLEAPGIELFFQNKGRKPRYLRTKTPGILDIITSFAKDKELDWHDCIQEYKPFQIGNPLYIISAGQSDDYISEVQHLELQKLFIEKGLGDYLNRLRLEWANEFDFVLIDSRTGINDICAICTILLPDFVVLFFTNNWQSVLGVAEVMQKSREAQTELPFGRSRLSAIPVLSRDESQSEYELSYKWKKNIGKVLREFYIDWVPSDVRPEDVLSKISIPYIPYWNFGEPLPVVEKLEDINDARSIVAAYARLARLLYTRLDWSKLPQEEYTIHIHERDLGKLLFSLKNLEMVVIILNQIDRPSGLLKEAIAKQIGNNVKFIFFISRHNYEKEKEVKYKYYRELVEKVKQQKKTILSIEKLVKFERLPFDWHDAPYLFYRCLDSEGKIIFKNSIAFFGDVIKKGIAKTYCDVPANFAFSILNAITGVASVETNELIGFVEEDEFADKSYIQNIIMKLKSNHEK